VVDYSLRLKSELGRKTTWVSSYSNDVMAYIPSRRVRLEGGYEGGDARYPYGLPAPWDPGIEEQIVAEAHKLAGKVGAQ
jgi:neutral ceramidase